MSKKGISTLLVKGVHAHLHRKLVADQVLQLPTGHQQNLQHHQDEPKVVTHHLIEPQHLTKPHLLTELHLLTEPQRHLLAGRQLHKQIDRHHQTDLLLQIDHPHHHVHRALAVLAEVAEEVEDDKFFIQTIL